jgi:hypothetical protein
MPNQVDPSVRATASKDNVLYAKGTSRCCNARMRLVRSRAGGFVARDCECCGRSYYVGWGHLPDLSCGLCGRQLVVRMSDGKNYYYACGHCNTAWKLASILPHWSEHFAYCGLATPWEGAFD